MNNKTGIAGFSIALGLQMAIMAPFVNADIVLDGTLGSSGAISGPDYVIDQAQGRTSGTNLYQSFEHFDISSTESATFTGSSAIQNIFSRVTGGAMSTIDGVLNVDIPDANFYFLNPAGVIFGPNASINIDGSFNVSTADYLRFADGGRFDATHPSQSVLSVAAPSAYGFLEGNSGVIEVNGGDAYFGANIISKTGKDINFVGNSIILDSATLRAPLGSISLTAVKGRRGELHMGTRTTAPHGMNMQGDITMRNNSFVDVGPFYLGDDTLNKPNGAVFIRAGKFVMNKSYIVSNNTSSEKPGDISIEVDSASMTNGAVVASEARGSADFKNADIVVNIENDLYLSDLDDSALPDTPVARRSGFYSGRFSSNGGGKIVVHAENIYANGGHFKNKGGTIDISADDTLFLSDIPQSDYAVSYPYESGNRRYTSGTGASKAVYSKSVNSEFGDNTADISLSAKNIVMKDATIYSDVSSFDKQKSGKINLTAEDSITMRRSNILSSGGEKGTPGDITIKAKLLDMGDSSTITASTPKPVVFWISTLGEIPYISTGTLPPSTGPGGLINIDTDTLRLADTVQDNGETWQTAIVSSSEGAGKAGDIVITTKKLEMTGSVAIFAEANNAETSAPAGAITINADDITMAGSEAVSPYSAATIGVASKSKGDAGSIAINAKELSMDKGAAITADTGGEGAGGAIQITADSVDLSTNAKITNSTSSQGNAGNISISAKKLNIESGGRVVAETTGEGSAGSIDIKNVESLFLSGNGSRITTDTFGSGQGGTLSIQARNARLRDGAQITTTSYGTGNAGQITLDISKKLSLSGVETQIGSESKGSGAGGIIDINAGKLHLDNGARISTVAYDTGDAGNIVLAAANDVVIHGPQTGIYAGTQGAGEGGNINITGRRLMMSDGALIRSSSQGTGDAGNIFVKTTKSIVLKDSAIETESEKAGGGSITLLTKKLLKLDNSTVSTSVNSGAGDAGNIFIDPERVILTNSTIKANAVSGDGGNVYIQAGVLIKDTDSVIEASSEYGIDGDVVIDAPVITTSNGDDKPTHLVKTKLLKSRCMAKRSKDSTLVVRSNMRHSIVSAGKYHYASLSDIKTNNAPALMLAKGQCR